MYAPLGIALRFLLVVAVVGLFAAVLTPSDPADSPYLSALSGVAVSETFAQPPACNNKLCDDQIPPKCLKAKGFKCNILGNRCGSGPC
jgi:hypothetical protein